VQGVVSVAVYNSNGTLAGAKPATVLKVKNIINNALEQAVKSRLIMYNPTRATVPPKME